MIPNNTFHFRSFGPSVAADSNQVEILETSAEGVEAFRLRSAIFDPKTKAILKKGGKMVMDAPADGLSYFYTSFSPKEENILLEADVFIEEMNPVPDGQEGVGLLIRDSLKGSGSHLSNQIGIVGTRLPINGKEYKDLIGFRAFYGIKDPEDPAKNQMISKRRAFSSEKNLLSQGKSYRFSIEKTDASYICRQFFFNEEDNTYKLLDEERLYIRAKDPRAESIDSYEDLEDPMCVQEENASIGFVVARGVNAVFSNFRFLKTPCDAKKWYREANQAFDLKLSVHASHSTGAAKEKVYLQANVDGSCSIYNSEDEIIDCIQLDANEEKVLLLEFEEAVNVFRAKFSAKNDTLEDPYQFLAETIVEEEFRIEQKVIGNIDGEVFVSPIASASAKGESLEQPTSLETALAYLRPGMHLVLEAGKYNCSKRNIFISRNLLTSEEKRIRISSRVNPTSAKSSYAVLDFEGSGEGVSLEADYIDLEGLAICNSRSGRNGLRISGSYNCIKNCYFFNNGNTGLQITSNYPAKRLLWPKHNLVISCVAMNNADRQIADADGFAAKIAVGEGNVFDSCLSAYNADDGFDLFAKVSTGTIAPICIRNCLSYRNGFILLAKGSSAPRASLEEMFNDVCADYSLIKDALLDIRFPNFYFSEDGVLCFDGHLGREIFLYNAANGNGFKMGGSNLAAKHCLKHSLALENKANGVDSNSCPDIQVFDVLSLDNGKSNIALYTENKEAQTDFRVQEFYSLRSNLQDSKQDKERTRGSLKQCLPDRFDLQGQEERLVYGSENYYFGESACSQNWDKEDLKSQKYTHLQSQFFKKKKARASSAMQELEALQAFLKES